jgi:hypothetical protein
MISLMTAHHIKPSSRSDKGNFLLDVPKDLINIPSWLKDKCLTDGFKEKSEYHVTVIARTLADTIVDLGISDQINTVIQGYNWSIELTDTYLEIAKDSDYGVHRQSIIQLVDVPELDAFFDSLEEMVKSPVARPPAHVTIFTKNYDRGIGIYSQDDLDRYMIRKLSS